MSKFDFKKSLAEVGLIKDSETVAKGVLRNAMEDIARMYPGAAYAIAQLAARIFKK